MVDGGDRVMVRGIDQNDAVKSGNEIESHDPAAIRQPPPLHCLLAFEAVARNLNLAKAAGELRLTASAVTQSIALLEARLGLKLLRTLAPVVELTDAGRDYFATVQDFVHRLRDGLYERFPLGRTQLRITASQALGRLWLAPRLQRFTQRHPRIDLVITSTEQFQSLRGGGLDVALRYGGAPAEGLVSRPLWTDRHVAVGAPALARRADGLSPAAIVKSLPLIDHPVSSWSGWLAALAPDEGPVRARLQCSDLHLAIEAACLGLGLVIVPARVVHELLARRVLRLASPHAGPGKAYQAFVSVEQAQRAPVQAFLHWLADEAGAAPARSA